MSKTNKELIYQNDYISVSLVKELNLTNENDYQCLTESEANEVGIDLNTKKPQNINIKSRTYSLEFKDTDGNTSYYAINFASVTNIDEIVSIKLLRKQTAEILIKRNHVLIGNILYNINNQDKITIDKTEVNSTEGYNFKAFGLSKIEFEKLEQLASSQALAMLTGDQMGPDNFYSVYNTFYREFLLKLINDNKFVEKESENIKTLQKKFNDYPTSL